MTLSRLAAVAAILLALFTSPPAHAATPDPQVPTALVPTGRHDMALPHSPQLLARLTTTKAMARPALAGTQGIDVSAYQHPNGAAINWGAVAGAGYTFAAIKTTEGTYYTNPYFASDYAAAKQAGFYVAAYHFATPDTTDGTTQADYAVNHAQYAADGRTLPIELDIEYNPYGAECYGLSASAMVGWVQAFSGEVRARTGRLPMIYSTADWWNTCTGHSTALGANPLWVAAYSTSNPPIPAGWGGYTCWQYTSTGSVPGVSGNVDVSYFDGDTNALAAFAGGSTAPASRTSSTVATSPQFDDGDQTDVFRVAADGTLEVDWVLGGGNWNGPLAISAAGFAPAGAQVVAINQFGLTDQTDVFVVDKTGTVQVFWVQGNGNWNGPLAVSAAGVAPAGTALAASNQFGLASQTDVFVVDKTGTLDTYYVDGGGNWNGPHAISPAGTAPAGAALAVSNQFGLAGQTDLLVVDSVGTVDVYWVVDAGNWAGPVAMSAAGVAPAGAALAASNQFGSPIRPTCSSWTRPAPWTPTMWTAAETGTGRSRSARPVPHRRERRWP